MRSGYGVLFRAVLLAGVGLFVSACPTTDPVTACDPTNDTPCFEGYACDPDARICRRACADAGDCLGGESCDTVVGICMSDEIPGDSVNAGDSSGGDSAGD